tara:strand:- start:586 stop:1257 length:672 start_codon:yes stop_codon:yes gene_type:complete
MKVKLGPYKSYFGPYQLAEQLKYLGFSENMQDRIGEALSNTWVKRVLNKIDEKFKQRKTKVVVHKYDTWSVDSTLAYVIVPILKQFKESTHGAPKVDDEDVPESLKATDTPAGGWDTENNAYHAGDFPAGVDANHFKRWDYVLDEMIWAFSQVNADWEDQYWPAAPSSASCRARARRSDDIYSSADVWDLKKPSFDHKGFAKHEQRMVKGFKMFGKYYNSLWD